MEQSGGDLRRFSARADGTLRSARVSDLLARVLARERPVRVVDARGGWVTVYELAALLSASRPEHR